MSFWLGAFLKRRRQRREEMLSALEAEYNVKARDEDEVSARSGNHPCSLPSAHPGSRGGNPPAAMAGPDRWCIRGVPSQ